MNPLEFNKDIGEMNEAEARATLREVRSQYDDARQDYEGLQDEIDEYKDEQEKLESDLDQYKEAAAEAHDFFAGQAAEVKDMDKETIKEKFSTKEIRSDLLDDVEFRVAGDGDEEEESKFEDNPEQSDNLGGDTEEWYETEAKQAVESITVQHDEF